MPSAILDFVKLNEKVDYSLIIPVCVGYVFLFWFLVSIWLYTDARKRIEKRRYAIILFLLNLIFGIPFLLLYLLARPMDREEVDQLSGGINIPVVNFVGKDGVAMSFELKINPKGFDPNSIKNGSDAHLKVDIGLETKGDEGFKITSVEEEKTDGKLGLKQDDVKIEKESKKKVGFINKLFSGLNRGKGKNKKDLSNKKENDMNKKDETNNIKATKESKAPKKGNKKRRQ